MEPTTLALRAAWESFYVIVGSSAAALTGLQFVVIVLGTQINVLGSASTSTFGTPTIVHFCAALLTAAILSAPWPALSNAGVCLATCGAVGVVYALIVIRRARQQTEYKPVFEDWVWYGVLPLLAYASLLVAAISLLRYPTPSLFVIAGTTLLLLFIGIHNAWDAVTYIAVDRRHQPGQPAEDNADCAQ